MFPRTWTLLELSALCDDDEKRVEFLKNRGLIPDGVKCPNCGWNMRLYGTFWKCLKTLKTKKGKKPCGKKVSANKNTLFENSKLSQKQILLLTYMLINNYQRNLIIKELKLNKNTVGQWDIFIKEVIMEWIYINSTPIGGDGKLVEVDESKFGKRKCNRSRIFGGLGVFGGICRETKKIFLVPVEDKKSSTLINIIKQWVLPGSTIISDCWKGYKDLSKEGYEDLTVNHSVTFIDSNSGAHTNKVKSTWRNCMGILPACNKKKYTLVEYLPYYVFHNESKKKHADLFDILLTQISQIKFDCTRNIESGSENEESSESDIE